MIKTLEIKNFKSIKQLKLECKKINVFIGEPNTGKSNILEALGIFSYSFGAQYGAESRDFIRFERTSNLFYDEVLDEPVRISLDDINFNLLFKSGGFEGRIHIGEQVVVKLGGGYDDLTFAGGWYDKLNSFKSYKFVVQNDFPRSESDFLLPPSGRNLMSLILARKELRSLANDIFSRFGLRLGLRPQENKIEVVKQLEDIIISYPYSLTSDTLQRIIFYLFAVLSNKDSIITFEEPESHAFPYYTKYLAETMALDEKNNQYFITTHNPYLLLPLVEKAPKDSLAVFITYYEDYQTKVKPLTTDQIEKMMEIDIFSNLDMFLEEK